MFKMFLVIATITVGLPMAALAEPSAGDAIRAKETEMVQGYIIGVGRGLEWANAALSNKNQPLLFCAPDKLGMVGPQFIAILEQQVKNNPAMGAELTGVVLLKGLQETFPCR